MPTEVLMAGAWLTVATASALVIPRSFRAAAAPLILLIGACTSAVVLRPSTPGVLPDAALHADVAQARAVLSVLAEQSVGISVAVARDGGVVWSESYGYSDLERRRPATPATVFRLYSISKPMTAVAAARLLEQGRLDADAPVQRYVPRFPDKGASITPMQVATHTSGIRHYANDREAMSLRHCTSVADAMEVFAHDPLVHAPGERETYSSWGFVLLSGVLEGATNLSYEQAMTQLVFQPLDMNSMRIDDPRASVAGRGRFYAETSPGAFALAREVDNTCKWGAGAWLGTAEDVARFGLSLVAGSHLQPQTRQLFLRGQTVYRAQGIGPGGAAFLLVDDAHDISIALLSNTLGDTLGPSLQNTVTRLHEIFADPPPAQ